MIASIERIFIIRERQGMKKSVLQWIRAAPGFVSQGVVQNIGVFVCRIDPNFSRNVLAFSQVGPAQNLFKVSLTTGQKMAYLKIYNE